MEILGATSWCMIRCGDGILGGFEKCDNGNKLGCSINCKIDIGYTCIGTVGARSFCSTTCGDSVKAGNQYFDNGKKMGCRNCVI